MGVWGLPLPDPRMAGVCTGRQVGKGLGVDGG